MAEASFLTDILSPRAEAGGETITSTKAPANSQTLALLEASALSPLLDKKTSKNEEKSSKEETAVDENTAINISGGALLPAATPATPDEDVAYSDGEYNLDIYVVRKGDTVPQIAEMFDITADTIYSANDLAKGAKVKEGDVLIILPFSGVEHTVKKGETLKGIATKYKVPVDDIAGYNELSGSKIAVGQKLMIPGGAILEEAKKPAKKPANTSSGRLPVYDSTPATNADGYYIKPIPCRLTQGRHDRYAVDMGCRVVGTPILAAASGEVIFSKAGAWNGGYGGLVIIKHPNGTLTYYAHQSKIIVEKGDSVNQGQVIGYVGNTGRSTGPHLHFEVRGAKNPGFDNSWKPWN
ncbi:MAG: peptidoglycan DD-metalloendopeptidase family protein [Candidatus Paceibacteria bacterium]